MTSKRIYPLPGRDSILNRVFLVFGLLPIMVGFVIVLVGQSITYIVCGGPFVLVGLFAIWTMVKVNWVANTFRRGTAMTEAKVVKRYTKIKQGGHAHVTINYEVYGFNFTFYPSQAKKPREITASLEGSGPLFSNLNTGDKVIIEYAIEKPLIFVLEGESQWSTKRR